MLSANQSFLQSKMLCELLPCGVSCTFTLRKRESIGYLNHTITQRVGKNVTTNSSCRRLFPLLEPASSKQFGYVTDSVLITYFSPSHGNLDCRESPNDLRKGMIMRHTEPVDIFLMIAGRRKFTFAGIFSPLYTFLLLMKEI